MDEKEISSKIAMGKIKKIVFCAGGNERANAWLEYAIASIREYFVPGLEIYVATNGKCDIPGVRVINANPLISELGFDRIMSFRYHRGNCDPMILFRLAIPLLEEFRRDDSVLYIDADTEIVDGRFFDIFNRFFDYDILACKDFDSFAQRKMTGFMFDREIVRHMRKNAKERMYKHLYANSGMMMFNLEHIRKSRPKYKTEIKDMLDLMVDKRLFWDQDIINIYFSIDFIGREYNFFPKMFSDGDHPYMIHYAGGAKMNGEYPPPSERELVIKKS